MNDLYISTAHSFWGLLAEGMDVVVATVDGDGVAARTVSTVPFEGKIYFCTFNNSNKLAQMQKNPKIALCAGPIQISGTTKVVGNPNAPEHKAVSDAMKVAFQDDYENFCKAPNVVLMEIEPLVASFGSETGDVFVLDFAAETAQQLKIEY